MLNLLKFVFFLHLLSFSSYLYAQNESYSLEGLIRQALSSYPSILSKQASKDAAISEVDSAKLKFLPSPSISTQMNQVTYSGAEPANLPGKTITISQPLLLDGGLVAGYRKAQARLSAADYSILEAREDVAKRLITYYAEWLRAWLKIQALEENLRLHEKLVGTITRRFQQGVADRKSVV
jgi:adhesin transport system outer membrane protein